MKKTILIFFAVVLALVAAFGLVACSEPVTVEISKTTAEVTVGKTVKLTATASDGSEIVWTSSDTDIATVNNGSVKGIEAGNVTITATSGDASASCEVTVKEDIKVTISQTSANLYINDTVTLTASSSDGKAITWTSSDPSVASVENGVVTALKAGTANITAASENAKASCFVAVTERPLMIGETAVTFTGNEEYIVTYENGSVMNITYEGVSSKSYKNIKSNDLTAEIGTNNAFTFKVTNNGEADAKVRVDIACADGLGTGGYDFCNQGAIIEGAVSFGNGYSAGNQDGDWLVIAPGTTATATIVFDNKVANGITLFIDSSTWTPDTEEPVMNSGNLSFSEIAFTTAVIDDEGDEEPAASDSVTIGGTAVTFSGNEDYIISYLDDSVMNVDYEGVAGNSYKNIKSNDLTSVIGTNNAFSFKLTNNGDADAKIRVQIDCEVGKGNPANPTNEFSNISAQVDGAVETGNDYAYNGGDWITVAAGETASITIIFDSAAESSGITFFIDSCTYYPDPETVPTFTGSLAFSELEFKTVDVNAD